MNNIARLRTLTAAFALVGFSCSLILETDNAQCTTTSDCEGLGPAFIGYTCTPDNVCAKASDYCDTNQQCVAANGGKPFLCDPGTHKCTEGCADAADGTKTGNQQCNDANPGKAFICDSVTHQCAEGCADSANGTKNADQQCVDANGPKFICKNAKCVDGCRAPVDGSKTATQVCIDTRGPQYVCNSDEQCAIGCETDAQCVSANGPLSICSTDKTCHVGCRTNAACIDAKGETFTCVKETNTCIDLVAAGSGCYTVVKDPLPDLRNDDIIFTAHLGALKTGVTAPNYGDLEGQELARFEIMSATGGGLHMGAKKRPVALLVCDTNVDGDAATQHVIDLHLHAVIGPFNSGPNLKYWPKLAAAGIMAMTGSAGAAEVANLAKSPASNGLLWRAGPNDTFTSLPKFLTDYVEPQLRVKDSIDPATGALKVGVAAQSDALGLDFSAYAGANLVFNGLSAAANATNSNYSVFDIGNPASDPDSPAKQAAAAQALLTFKPHVILVGIQNAAYQAVFVPMEQGWTEPNYRPVYFLGLSGLQPATVNFVNAAFPAGPQREDLRRRVINLNIPITWTSPDTTALSLYRSRHTSHFAAPFLWSDLPRAAGATTAPAAGGPNQLSPEFYDSQYAMLYAMVATQKENPTGAEISAAIGKLQPPGEVHNVDPGDITTALAKLAAGGSIDLQGVMSTLDFTDHIVSLPFAMFCIKTGAASPSQTSPSFIYDPKTNTFSGSPPVNMVFPSCP